MTDAGGGKEKNPADYLRLLRLRRPHALLIEYLIARAVRRESDTWLVQCRSAADEKQGLGG